MESIIKDLKVLILDKRKQIQQFERELSKLQSMLNDITKSMKGINRASKISKFNTQELTNRLIRSMDPNAQ